MSILDKLNPLWEKLMDTGVPKLSDCMLYVDIDTHRAMRIELDPSELDMTEVGLFWRGIPITHVHRLLIGNYVYVQPANCATSIDNTIPFCMYVKYSKDNGRICYIDHLDTDPRYL